MEGSERENRDSAMDESNVSVDFEPSLSRNGDSDKQTDQFLPQTSSDAMAKGLSSMITNIMKDFDSRADNTVKSQDQLSSALDRLARELDQLLEDAPLPFIMQHAARISGVRKRVSSLNSVLKSIQRRVDNIDRMLFVDMQPGFYECRKDQTSFPERHQEWPSQFIHRNHNDRNCLCFLVPTENQNFPEQMHGRLPARGYSVV